MTIYEEILEDWAQMGIDFRVNDINDDLEAVIPGKEWSILDNSLLEIIKLEMREMDYGTRKKPAFGAVTGAMHKRADYNRYNPVHDYFESLTYKPLASGPYFIPALASYFDNPDGQLHRWLFLWLTGAIAKIFEQARNPMLVLVSEQGIGKSWFCKWLCPLNDFFLESRISPDNKDHSFRLLDTLVWEVSELGATTRRQDVESLKAFITQKFVRDRRVYAIQAMRKPTIASFIGTVNFDGAGFLVDRTGNTRFLASQVSSIDFAYSKEMSPHDLWAEAYWYYCHVPGCWLPTSEDRHNQDKINEGYETPNALQEVIEDLFQITDRQEDFIPTETITNLVEGHYRITNQQAFRMELGRVARKLGLEKGRSPRAEGYRHGWHGLVRKDT